MLGISESTLTHYELGVTKNIPVDEVVMMAELYNAPELKNHFCKFECPIGKNKPTATEEVSLAEATVHILQNIDMSCIEALTRNLLRIAGDNVITDAERAELEKILEAIDSISKAGSELHLIAEKRREGTENGTV